MRIDPSGTGSRWRNTTATRLLDWTYSPYVALHFVTESILSYDQDGAIWCVNYVKSNEYLPGV